MANTLDQWFSKPAKPQITHGVKAPALPPTPEPVVPPKTEEAPEPQPVKRKRVPQTFPPIAPPNLPPSYFISAMYDGRQKKSRG